MDSQSIFRQVNILYYALLAGQVLFCLVVLFGVLDPDARQSGWPEAPFGLVVPVLMASTMSAAFFINNRQLSQATDQPNLGAKINHYRSTVILRSALIEGGNLFCLVVLLLENNSTYLFLFAAGLLVFLYFRPGLNEFTQHYALSGAEQAEINQLS